MNIFEDLIDELKEENLLEETVIQPKTSKDNPVAAESARKKDQPSKEFLEAGILEDKVLPVTKIMPEAEVKPKIVETVENDPAPADPLISEEDRKKAEAEFYRKQAMDEVSFLQMVERVFAGVEREQLKAVPKPYDDLEIKKILHSFLQNSHEPQSPEHAKAQFRLLQETESWHMSLSMRDERILTAHLRRFCETSRPPLSSPALVALARFYRNSTYSEAVRSKFDLLVTRLFSKETANSKREALFEYDELVKHLTELYADWSSVSIYPTETNDAQIGKIVRQFENFKAEAAAAVGFDDLINSDFFNRLHSFKESTNTNFFAPQITATAVESNIHIGNRYVELLESEKQRSDIAHLENKYGFSHDQAISETTGKTFTLIELLNQKTVEPAVEDSVVQNEPVAVEEKNYRPVNEDEAVAPSGLSKSAKYLIGAVVFGTLLLILAGYFLFASDSREEIIIKREISANAQKVNLENSMLMKSHLEEADIDNDTLHGIILPNWEKQTEDEKIGTATQMLKLGKEKGFSKIQLTDRAGKVFASGTEGDVYVWH